jgi:hypothetical protein
MAKKKRPAVSAALPVLQADLQIDFWARLQQIRHKHLSDALAEALAECDITVIDHELGEFAGREGLAILARYGLRGETFFPVVTLLTAKPELLGYYRLLYGISQKEFYKSGFGRFRSMEMNNQLSEENARLLPTLCASLGKTAFGLLQGIQPISLNSIHELQLLTLGPQLRGSQNVTIGKGATKQVFDVVRKLVRDHVESSTERVISVKNAAGRIVQIAFAADPDITIIEMLPSGAMPNTSIEIKGGADVSNVHNRIGEAEKSHLNAKKNGFTRFWTIVKAKIDAEAAKRQSPTTTAFFNLDEIRDRRGKGHARFKELLHQTIGIS